MHGAGRRGILNTGVSGSISKKSRYSVGVGRPGPAWSDSGRDSTSLGLSGVLGRAPVTAKACFAAYAISTCSKFWKNFPGYLSIRGSMSEPIGSLAAPYENVPSWFGDRVSSDPSDLTLSSLSKTLPRSMRADSGCSYPGCLSGTVYIFGTRSANDHVVCGMSLPTANCGSPPTLVQVPAGPTFGASEGSESRFFVLAWGVPKVACGTSTLSMSIAWVAGGDRDNLK